MDQRHTRVAELPIAEMGKKIIVTEHRGHVPSQISEYPCTRKCSLPIYKFSSITG